jgi:hypothetical protein
MSAGTPPPPPPPPGGPGPGEPGPPAGGQQPAQAPPTQPYGGYQPAPHQYQQQHDGPGFQDRAAQAAEQFARHVKTPETKEFFKTSEFIVWALTVAMVAIAGSVISGDSDNLIGSEVWLYVTVVSAAYIISRGLAKAGTGRGRGSDEHRGY